MHHLISRSEKNPVARRSSEPKRLIKSHNHRGKEKPTTHHQLETTGNRNLKQNDGAREEEKHQRQQRGRRRRSPPRSPARSAANGEAEEADLGFMKTAMEKKTLDFDNLTKPVFLTKAHRKELALKRCQDEIADRDRRRIVQISRSNCDNGDGNRSRDVKRERHRSHDHDRNRESDREFRERDVKARVKKLEMPSKNFRFDWENTEDTSSGEMNVLYQNPHEAQPLFGRGCRAGIDRREQRKLMTGKHEREKREEEDKHWRSKIPHPMRTWEETIPLGLEQRDVIGISATGSGKTAAFFLPMLAYISRLPPMREENQTEGPYALVMVPTRELAHQIEEEMVKFSRYLGFKAISITGGESIEKQVFKLSQGCEIVIATLGRLLDCLERRYVVLNQCNYLVLDEADRMIDMGFEPQVSEVLDAMSSTNLKTEKEYEELEEKKIYRTTYMFSATMHPSVERLARKFLRNHVVVTIGETTKFITQQVIMTKESDKFSRLKKLIDDLGKSQGQRDYSLEEFKKKRFNVLVTTDVLGRGLDILDLAQVINYDMPNTMDLYTHRIGRTGRAGKTGVATTFLTLEDKDVFYGLKQKLIECNSLVPPELARHEASKFKPGTFPDRFSNF
ncbi:Helicase superfamily 1/2 ATP-binding domain [Arabidopsis thaliana x Arabidopsis arenosa]|uniref:RNA helicase n=1 Tax=Arabidopsis thaliana x Arabidopsis arenosa TaxID=1240361 RepID=A0A8T2GKM0_9BRAS|nr:Helicase superfamily 1/2 ATP-binding domain [Arabidopsis thaliana x Arabidopsis arenosa]